MCIRDRTQVDADDGDVLGIGAFAQVQHLIGIAEPFARLIIVLLLQFDPTDVVDDIADLRAVVAVQPAPCLLYTSRCV